VPALNQHAEDLTFVVDGAPEVQPLAGDPDHHFGRSAEEDVVVVGARSPGPNFSTQLRIVS